MDLTKIISISGMPGLYKVVGAMKQGAVVESLNDGKRFPTFASHKISSLSDISIYTSGESIPLTDVLRKIYEKEGGKETPPMGSDAEAIKKYFESVLPDYDKERVHNSDMKKLIGWYNVLLKKDLLKPEETKVEEPAEGEKPGEEKVADTGSAVPIPEKILGKKPEIHSAPLHTPKPNTSAPKKNINVRRKTG